MDMPALEAIATAGSFVVAIVAFVASWKTGKKQSEADERIARNHAEAQERIANNHANLEKQLRAQYDDYERKKFVTTLWDKLAEVNVLEKPKGGTYDDIATAIYYAVSTLELVSICWTHNLVDQDMMYLVFGVNYMARVNDIRRIREPIIGYKDGDDLLDAHKTIGDVYELIRKKQAAATPGRVTS
jgi:hypothetical protein